MSKATSDGAMETAVDTRGNVWKRPGVLMSGAAAVLLVVFGASTLANVLGEQESKAPPAGASVATARPEAASTRPARAASPIEKPRYRISGIVGSTDQQHAVAMLTDDRGDTTFIPARDCEYARMQWRCKYRGEWISMRPSEQRPQLPAVPSPPSILPATGA